MIKKTNLGFTLIELLVVISIIALLAGIALPVFSQVQERAAQTKDLSNAKQIGLACKLFATDNDGLYPNRDGRSAVVPQPVLTGGAGETSNQAFAVLVPDYLATEKLFYIGKSVWSPNVPDEDTTTPAVRVEQSTNGYAYVLGLTDTSNPSFPLIVDAPQPAVTTYTTDQGTKGGVWKGKKAVVVRADQSGSVEKCTLAGGTSTIIGQNGTGTPADILAPSSPTWLNATTNPKLYPDTP